MNTSELVPLIQKIIAAIEKQIPAYLAVEADRKLNNGNSAVCIIDEFGAVHGKMFGSDKIRLRQCFRVAWTKASQVWITGLKTGEFEKLVYAGKLDEHTFGISRPDFIGWEGGQPILLNSKIKLAAGFSGFRGISDLEIVQNAVSEAARKE